MSVDSGLRLASAPEQLSNLETILVPRACVLADGCWERHDFPSRGMLLALLRIRLRSGLPFSSGCFLGLPPFFPFSRAARFFASLVDLPPSRPRVAAALLTSFIWLLLI